MGQNDLDVVKSQTASHFVTELPGQKVSF